jgi:hypothetical protein
MWLKYPFFVPIELLGCTEKILINHNHQRHQCSIIKFVYLIYAKHQNTIHR